MALRSLTPQVSKPLTEEDIVERAERSRRRRVRFAIFLLLLAVAAAVWAILQ